MSETNDVAISLNNVVASESINVYQMDSFELHRYDIQGDENRI